MDLSFALLLLMDLVLALAAQPFLGMRPDALLRGVNGGSGRTVQRHKISRFPLYMMQLYRTMLSEDRAGIPFTTVSQTEDNPGLHDSDSVISLAAKSKYSAFNKSNF